MENWWEMLRKFLYAFGSFMLFVFLINNIPALGRIVQPIGKPESPFYELGQRLQAAS